MARTKTQIIAIIGKNIIALSIVGAVIVAIIAASFAIYTATRSNTTTQQAEQQAAKAKAENDGTTHDMTIVWPDGIEQPLKYSETITPKVSTYTGPKNRHRTVIDMFSFNPLDSANKAGEGIKPNSFAEGDRPSIDIDESGVKTSKSKGAVAVGESGSYPSMGEYLGWAGIAMLGVVGLFVILGVGKWIWATWQKVEPLVGAAVVAAIPASAPLVAAVTGATLASAAATTPPPAPPTTPAPPTVP